MIKKILPDGTKTKTGIYSLVVIIVALLGFEISEMDISKVAEAALALFGALSALLANYGYVDKGKRTEVAIQKAKEIDVKELMAEAKELIDRINK